MKGLISNESPLGKALVGSKIGQEIEVESADGISRYKVLEISRSETRDLVEEAVYTNIREREDNCRTNQISERFLIFCLAAVFRIYGERFFRLSL